MFLHSEFCYFLPAFSQFLFVHMPVMTFPFPFFYGEWVAREMSPEAIEFLFGTVSFEVVRAGVRPGIEQSRSTGGKGGHEPFGQSPGLKETRVSHPTSTIARGSQSTFVSIPSYPKGLQTTRV